MKKLFLLVLFVTLSFSLEGQAYGDIVVSINNEIFKLKDGEKVSINDGDKICYIAGSGEFEVLNRSINEDSYGCFSIVKNKSNNKYEIMEKLINVVFNSTDTEVNGVTLRAPSVEVDFENQKYLRISVKENKLPLKVKIYTKNRIYLRKVKEDEVVLDLSRYRDIKKIVVVDKSNKELLNMKNLEI